VPARVPKLLSPQAHRRFDLCALPGLVAAAALMARRDRAAAALMLMTAAGEGTALLTTRYPPAALGGWLSFEQHLRVGYVHAAFIAAVGALVPGVQRRHRPVVSGLALVPLVLNALSDARPARRGARR
jgi:hypothetical protein